MTAGWVAAANRGRLLLRRTLGSGGTTNLARSGTWDEARAGLTATMYGHALPAEATRPIARVAAAAATSWQLQVLAGWCPPGASGLARVFAGPIEIHNIEQHLARLTRVDDASAPAPSARDDEPQPVPLGTLGTVWPRIGATTSPTAARTMLTHSSWGDPGGVDRTTVALGLRVSWLRRVTLHVPGGRELAAGAAAVLVARERFAFERDIAHATGRDADRLIGKAWRDATTLDVFARRLPKQAAWPLTSIDSPDDLWKAEVAVLHRTRADAQQQVNGSNFDRDAVAGIMGLFLLDLWRVTTAIDLAGRGFVTSEVFDDVA